MYELIPYIEPKKVFMYELISYIEPKKVFMYELISYIEPYMSVNHRFMIYLMHRAYSMSIAHYELSSFFWLYV